MKEMALGRNSDYYSFMGETHGDTILAVPATSLINGLQLGSANANPSTTLVDPASHRRDNLVTNMSNGGEVQEDIDFSDVVLKFIDQILMEENAEDEACMLQQSPLALEKAEKSFYEILGEKYPPTPASDSLLMSSTKIFRCPDHNCSGDRSEHNYSGCCTSRGLCDSCFSCNTTFYQQTVAADFHPQLSSQPSLSATSSILYNVNVSHVPESNIMPFSTSTKGELISQSREGPRGLLGEGTNEVGAVEKNLKAYHMNGSRGRKNFHFQEDLGDKHERRTKQLAVTTDTIETSELFDKMFLSYGEEEDSALPKALRNRATNIVKRRSQLKGPKSRMGRSGEGDWVDLKTLLTLCAEAIAANKREKADYLLKQIGKQSSRTGDGLQRLASYCVDALETRFTVSKTPDYNALVCRPITATDALTSHFAAFSVCPFMKLNYFFSNKAILSAAERASQFHIIDFGIYYGFQWPSFIEQLSRRSGGPPKLRITGIDFPQPGKRPEDKIKETGRCLEEFARRFSVPFEFEPLGQKWECIRLEDLKIKSDEVVVVNSMYRFRYIHDEAGTSECPRTTVLNLIKGLKPDVFILCESNASFCLPYFPSRFQEAMAYYTAMFDVLENLMPRETPERRTLEEILGREIGNVVACEGSERIERPESYKRWGVRLKRAGFKQIPLNKGMFKKAKERASSLYHKEFVVEEDRGFLLQGWKGRIVNTLSCWKPFK